MKLKKTLRNLFGQMGVSEELAIDGGGGVPAYKTKQWGINHSLSTV